MSNVKIISISIILCMIMFTRFLPAGTAADRYTVSATEGNYILAGGVLYHFDQAGVVRLHDKISAIHYSDSILYFIRCQEGGWSAGVIDEKGDRSAREFEIPGRYKKLIKFSGSGNSVYFLAVRCETEDSGAECTGRVLVRYNFDHRIMSSVDEVSDFMLNDGKAIIIKDGVLNYNGVRVPLQVSGELRISSVQDSRMAVVSGRDGSEVIDLLAGRSIYQYSFNHIAEIPADFNILIEFTDIIPESELASTGDESIYYRLFVDGVEQNRTETGIGRVLKVFRATLSTGSYHIIKAERWELDRLKGRYVRMNNIYQPGEFKIYMPENRVLKVRVEYNGKKYEMKQSVFFR